MNITNRLFAYPVLSDEKDDYKDSYFNVNYEHTMQGVNSLKLSFDISMNCCDLEQLIMDGKADYVIHLECLTTAYREVLHSVSKHIEHIIPIGRINGTFDAVAFVILKKNITDFFCSDWVDDFSDTTFNLFAGSILAYQNLRSLDITKDYEEFTNAGSIFSIKCCLLAAAYNNASVRASIAIFFLSRIIALICSAISMPPGSLVNNTLYPSAIN